MEIIQLLRSRRCPQVNTQKLKCQLNYSAISSQLPLQNSNASLSESESESYDMTDGQSASLS
jgi:hypothetical protein